MVKNLGELGMLQVNLSTDARYEDEETQQMVSDLGKQIAALRVKLTGM